MELLLVAAKKEVVSRLQHGHSRGQTGPMIMDVAAFTIPERLRGQLSGGS